MLRGEDLPPRTDVAFGGVGYYLNFVAEEDTFGPAAPVVDDPMEHDDDGAGAKGVSDAGAPQDHAAKRQKNISTSSSQAGGSSKPTPMQHAITPFGNCRPPPPLHPLIMNAHEA